MAYKRLYGVEIAFTDNVWMQGRFDGNSIFIWVESSNKMKALNAAKRRFYRNYSFGYSLRNAKYKIGRF